MENDVMQYFDVFLLVFARMGGMIFVNPVFSRRGVPLMVRTGLTLAVSLLVVPAAGASQAVIGAYTTFEMMEAMIREVIMGLAIGFIFQLFFYMIYVAGDLMDTVFGLAMGKVMDPVSGIQSSILGQFINVFLFLYFLATGCHLLMIKLFAYTYEVVPAGAASFVTRELSSYMITLFSTTFSMVIRLALPFVAAEFVLEVSMGVLMKLIPQIHVFVINIQAKILLGILLMFLFARPIGDFIDLYLDTMMQEAQKVMMLFG